MTRIRVVHHLRRRTFGAVDLDQRVGGQPVVPNLSTFDELFAGGYRGNRAGKHHT